MTTEYQGEIRKVLDLLGLKPTDIATPERLEKALKIIETERAFQAANNKVRAYHRAQERYFERCRLGGHVDAFFSKVAPPLPPVRKVLEPALLALQLPGRFQRRLAFRGFLLDFAYPSTRLCIRLGNENHDDALGALGWRILRFSEDEVRREPKACAAQVFRAYMEIRRERRQASR